MKLAIVVQRYGQAINGGAELHARYVAERLARHAEVEVLTTCATDYVTWRNELPTGVESLNGVQVRRFPVKHERNPLDFGRPVGARLPPGALSGGRAANGWMLKGRTAPPSSDYLSKHASAYDYCIVFSYRYHHAYHAVRAVAEKTILVPTAERDAADRAWRSSHQFSGAFAH